MISMNHLNCRMVVGWCLNYPIVDDCRSISGQVYYSRSQDCGSLVLAASPTEKFRIPMSSLDYFSERWHKRWDKCFPLPSMRLTKGWDTKELRCVSSEYTYDGMDASVPFISTSPLTGSIEIINSLSRICVLPF